MEDLAKLANLSERISMTQGENEGGGGGGGGAGGEGGGGVEGEGEGVSGGGREGGGGADDGSDGVEAGEEGEGTGEVSIDSLLSACNALVQRLQLVDTQLVQPSPHPQGRQPSPVVPVRMQVMELFVCETHKVGVKS